MRFMMLMYPQIEESEWSPDAEAMAAMSRYNEELKRAGLLLSLAGLRSPAAGASVEFDAGGTATVTDGPFAEAKEVVGGFWVIEARSVDEAVEWARRCPGRDCRVEVRRVQEMEEFPPDVQEAARSAQ